MTVGLRPQGAARLRERTGLGLLVCWEVALSRVKTAISDTPRATVEGARRPGWKCGRLEVRGRPLRGGGMGTSRARFEADSGADLFRIIIFTH